MEIFATSTSQLTTLFSKHLMFRVSHICNINIPNVAKKKNNKCIKIKRKTSILNWRLFRNVRKIFIIIVRFLIYNKMHHRHLQTATKVPYCTNPSFQRSLMKWPVLKCRLISVLKKKTWDKKRSENVSKSKEFLI